MNKVSEVLFDRIVALLNDDQSSIATILEEIHEIDKENGDLAVGEVFASLNVGGCLTLNQIYDSCILLAIAYLHDLYNSFWPHILCIIDCVFKREKSILWDLLTDIHITQSIIDKTKSDLRKMSCQTTISFESLRTQLNKQLNKNGISRTCYTTLPLQPSYHSLSTDILYSHYQSFSFPPVGFPSMHFSLSTPPLSIHNISLIPLPLPLSFLYDYQDRSLDSYSTLCSILSSSTQQTLSISQAQFIEKYHEEYKLILKQHQNEKEQFINTSNILSLCDFNPIIASDFIHSFMQNTHLRPIYLRLLISMKLNISRMEVLLKLFKLGDIDSFSIQSSILTRLLQFREEDERNQMISMYIEYLNSQKNVDITTELESFCIEFLDIPIVNQFFEKMKGDAT